MSIGSAIKGFFSSGGASGVLEGANQILGSIDGLSTSAEEKATLRKSVVESVVAAQSVVLMAEATSESFLARSWRPIVMLSFATILIMNFAIFPLIVFVGWADAALLTTIVMPSQLWLLLEIGLGGYVAGRSVEKITKVVMPTFKAKQILKMAKRGIDLKDTE